MKRFSTCINEEIADEFIAWCAARGQTPYDLLSAFIHKAVGKQKRVRQRIVSPDLQQMGHVEAAKRHLGVKACDRCGRPHGDCAHTVAG